MDLKVLFHNPEDLNDRELFKLQQQIKTQRALPKVTAFIGGFAVYVLDAAVLKRQFCRNRIIAGAVAGFALGAYSSLHVQTTIKRVEKDAEIISAFDIRYMNTVLNSTGFGSNYVSIKDYSDAQNMKKPY